jgi:ubiquitin conjugation factor E4 B
MCTCAVHLRDPVTLGELIELYGGVCEWLLHCAKKQPRAADTGALDVTAAWASLPEHLLTDMCQVLSVLDQQAPRLLEAQLPALRAIYALLCELLDGGNGYVTSPYLRAQLTDLIAQLVPRARLDDELAYEAAARVALRADEQWRDALLDDADLHARLPHGVMQLYIDIERTGRQSQFYDKFNIRYRLSQILRYAWHQPRYEPAFTHLVHQTDFFVRFVNHNLNDSIYLLDESFEKLQAIRTVEQMDQIAFQALTVQRQQELRTDHDRNVNLVQVFLRLANESVAMLHYMALRASDAFLRTDLVQRLATMLNYWLVKLVGPECTMLKVRAPLAGFEPKRLLARVTDVLVLFGRSTRFVEELADDGRSYTPELYQQAIHVLQKHAVGDASALSDLAARVEAAAQTSHFSEADLADAPDEFLDAIMSTLMRDPVRLPTCENVVDRATITRHLLNNPHCPFTRAPLTIEQLQPDAELRERIRAYRLAKACTAHVISRCIIQRTCGINRCDVSTARLTTERDVSYFKLADVSALHNRTRHIERPLWAEHILGAFGTIIAFGP